MTFEPLVGASVETRKRYTQKRRKKTKKIIPELLPNIQISQEQYCLNYILHFETF